MMNYIDQFIYTFFGMILKICERPQSSCQPIVLKIYVFMEPGPINKIMRRHIRLSSKCMTRGRGASVRCACVVCVRLISAIESDDIAKTMENIVEHKYETATTIAFRTYLFIEKWKSMKINLSMAVGVSKYSHTTYCMPPSRPH